MSFFVSPFPQFVDSDGNPTALYNVFFGQPDQDPKLFPKAPFSDKALKVPISTTQALDNRGMFTIDIFLKGAYSIRIETPAAVLFRSIPSFSGTSTANLGDGFTAAVAATDSSLLIGDFVITNGFAISNDGGQALYNVVAGGTGTADGILFINMTNGNQLQRLKIDQQIFDNVTIDAIAATWLAIGDTVKTYSFATSTDQGGADYNVVAGATGIDDKAIFHDMANGNQLQMVISDKLRSEQFGTIGNGVINDLVNLQKYFDSAQASGFQAVLTPGRTYFIQGALTTGPIDDKKTTVIGYGSLIIQGTNASSSLNIRNSKCSVVGVKFQSGPGVTKSKQAAIDILDVSDVSISECIFEDLTTAGISIRVEVGGICEDVSITDCKFNKCDSTAIIAEADVASVFIRRISINSCAFEAPTAPIDTQTRAIHIVANVEEVVISNNNANGVANVANTSGWRDCIQIGNSSSIMQPDNISIVNNSLTGMSDEPVGLSGATNITITGNVLYNSLNTAGVYVPGDGSWFNDNVVVSANTIYDCFQAGIFLKDTKNYTVDGNFMRNTVRGIFINDNGVGIETGSITGNTIKDVNLFGIAWDGGSCVCSGNIIDDSGDSGSGIISDRSAIVCNSFLEGSSIVGNVMKNGINGILLSDAPNNFVISQNVVTSSTDFGMYFLLFTGDNYIIANNRLNGTMGAFLSQPTPDATKIFDNNL